MNKHYFELSIKEKKNKEGNRYNFIIKDNKLLSEDYEALYNFDNIFYINEYKEKTNRKR